MILFIHDIKIYDVISFIQNSATVIAVSDRSIVLPSDTDIVPLFFVLWKVAFKLCFSPGIINSLNFKKSSKSALAPKINYILNNLSINLKSVK